jgi:integrase
MAIYKRGGSYWYEFIFEGRRIRRPAKTRSRKAARDIESAYRIKLAKGEVGLEEPKRVPTFAGALKEFLTWSEHQHAARPSTHHRYAVSSKALKRFFGATPLDRITAETVEKFKTSRARKKSDFTGRRLRPATINRELACLKILFNRFEDTVPKNPVRKVKFLAEDNEQMRVLTSDEEKLYLLAASQPLRDIATMMLETGMRPDEVCRIRRDNVHLDQGYLFNPFGKTKAARRKVPLTEKGCALLARRLEKVKGDFVFPGRATDQPIVKVNAAHVGTLARINRIRLEANESAVPRFRLYDLRHTWATRAAMAGIDLVTLAAMLGHSRIQMVLRYAHPTEEHQFAAMKKLEAFVARG